MDMVSCSPNLSCLSFIHCMVSNSKVKNDISAASGAPTPEYGRHKDMEDSFDLREAERKKKVYKKKKKNHQVDSINGTSLIIYFIYFRFKE